MYSGKLSTRFVLTWIQPQKMYKYIFKKKERKNTRMIFEPAHLCWQKHINPLCNDSRIRSENKLCKQYRLKGAGWLFSNRWAPCDSRYFNDSTEINMKENWKRIRNVDCIPSNHQHWCQPTIFTKYHHQQQQSLNTLIYL